MKELINIQAKLKAPKNQRNNFGKYNYRSCEDILEAVKPLLAEENSFLTLSDQIVNVGNRNYVEATATIHMPEDKEISVTASACESEVKKGMDSAQITGSASSYARKYALNGLFAIDDTKDSDATNTHGQQPTYTPPQQPIARPSVDQLNALFAQVKILGLQTADVGKILAQFGFKGSKDITLDKYQAVMDAVNNSKGN